MRSLSPETPPAPASATGGSVLGGAASAGGGVSTTRGSSVSCEKKIVSHSSRDTFLSPSRSESSNSRSVGLTLCAVASCGEGYRINTAVHVMVLGSGDRQTAAARRKKATAECQGTREYPSVSCPALSISACPNSEMIPASHTRASCQMLSGSHSEISHSCKDV
jgi:hypothetical protein